MYMIHLIFQLLETHPEPIGPIEMYGKYHYAVNCNNSNCLLGGNARQRHSCSEKLVRSPVRLLNSVIVSDLDTDEVI